jgi:hypothetical protein
METENNRTRFHLANRSELGATKPDLACFPCINLPAFNQFPKHLFEYTSSQFAFYIYIYFSEDFSNMDFSIKILV